MLLAQQVPPREVTEVLGHSRISVTMDLYAHVMPSALHAAADAMDSTFDAQSGVNDVRAAVCVRPSDGSTGKERACVSVRADHRLLDVAHPEGFEPPTF